MISIECHRSGERCPGKREFDNRIEINRVRSGEIMWLFPLTVPITVASNERSFSRLKLVKSYLRTTMTEHRFDDIMIGLITCESDIADKL